MTINRNLSFLADSAGALNTPTINLANSSGVTTISATASTGTINYDVITQSILYYTTAATGNWTLNVRGNSTVPFSSFISVGQSVNIKFMSTNGATAYLISGLQIDGSSRTITWAGGIAPVSGTASSINTYEFTIVCTAASTYTVLGSLSTFS